MFPLQNRCAAGKKTFNARKKQTKQTCCPVTLIWTQWTLVIVQIIGRKAEKVKKGNHYYIAKVYGNHDHSPIPKTDLDT